MSSFHPFAARGGLKYAEAYQTGDSIVDSARRPIFDTLDMLLDSHLARANPKRELELFKTLYDLLQDYFAREEAWAKGQNNDLIQAQIEQHQPILSDLLWRILSFADGRCTFNDVFTFVAFDIIIRHYSQERRAYKTAS